MTFHTRLQVRIWRPKDYAGEQQMRFQAGVAIVASFLNVLRLRYQLSGIGSGAVGWEAGYLKTDRTGAVR